MLLSGTLIVAGLAIGWFSFAQALEMRRFAARAERVGLRVVAIEEDVRHGGRGVGARTYVTPTLEVADGPHRGRRARGETGEGLHHAVGQVHRGRYDPTTGQARLETSVNGASGLEWGGAALGIVLFATGLAIVL